MYLYYVDNNTLNLTCVFLLPLKTISVYYLLYTFMFQILCSVRAQFARNYLRIFRTTVRSLINLYCIFSITGSKLNRKERTLVEEIGFQHFHVNLLRIAVIKFSICCWCKHGETGDSRASSPWLRNGAKLEVRTDLRFVLFVSVGNGDTNASIQ